MGWVKGYAAGHPQFPLRLKVFDFPPPFHCLRIGLDNHLRPGGQLAGIADKTGEKVAGGVIRLHPVIAPIADIDIAIAIHRHIGGMVQLAPAGTIAAELGQVLPFGGELLHPVVFAVGYIEATVGVLGQAPRGIKLAVAVAGPAELMDKLAVSGELLDPVIAAVDDVEVILPVADNTAGAVQFSGGVAGLTPLPQQMTGPVKDADPVQPFVGNIDPILGIEGNAGRPDKFAVPVAAAAELPQKFLLSGRLAHLDDTNPGAAGGAIPGDGGNGLAAPVEDQDRIVGGQGQGIGGTETHSGGRAPAHRVAEIVGPAGHYPRYHILPR